MGSGSTPDSAVLPASKSVAGLSPASGFRHSSKHPLCYYRHSHHRALRPGGQTDQGSALSLYALGSGPFLWFLPSCGIIQWCGSGSGYADDSQDHGLCMDRTDVLELIYSGTVMLR